MDATLVTLAYITGIALVALFVAVALWLRRLIADRRDGWQVDKHEGATEHSPALAVKAKEPAVVIARSPLIEDRALARAIAAGGAAEQRIREAQQRRQGGAGRHRAALSDPTAEFTTIAERETGKPLLAIGPSEVSLHPQRLVWDPSQPEVWRQESLPIEAS